MNPKKVIQMEIFHGLWPWHEFCSNKKGMCDLQEGYQTKVSGETNVRRNGFKIHMEEKLSSRKGNEIEVDG